MARRKHISKQTRIVLAFLAEHHAEWSYGYELCKSCNLKSGALYPILMRLDGDGLLTSRWEESDITGRPPRHMYQLTPSGRELATAQASDPSLPAIDFKGLSHA